MDWKDYEYYFEILKSGDREKLEELSQLDKNFPDGKDGHLNRCWIINAIDCGHIETIKWILEKKVDLNKQDDSGFSVFDSVLERNLDERYEILEMLLKSGADVNVHGTNDWTPAHTAAAYNDVRALKILVKYGADLFKRTRIDHYATPLEEARILDKIRKCKAAIKYLESLNPES